MEPPQRHILHVDMDAFFASVEQRDRPELRGKPILIGHDGPRGVVATASYEARRFGCHSAQPIAIAKRRCPQAIIVQPDGARYREASEQVFEIFEQFTPLIQPLSIDEAFLDVTGSLRLLGSPRDIALAIKRRIAERTQLTASVGVAPNKFLAKIASELDKPDGLTIIEPTDVQRVLDALGIEAIPGIGPVARRAFHDLGATTIRAARGLDLSELEHRFGSSARRYWELFRGIDERPVVPDGEAKSIGHEQTFGQDLEEPEAIRRVMLWQTEQVARRLRRHGLQARTLTVKIRYGDFETITRSHTLPEPTAHTDTLWAVAKQLFDAWIAREGFKPVRLIGVTATQFDADAQLGLFGAQETSKRDAVERATDRIAERFGKTSIRRAGTLRGRDEDP